MQSWHRPESSVSDEATSRREARRKTHNVNFSREEVVLGPLYDFGLEPGVERRGLEALRSQHFDVDLGLLLHGDINESRPWVGTQKPEQFFKALVALRLDMKA